MYITWKICIIVAKTRLRIPDMVVNAQSLQVDTISGATNSSKTILKAMENALISGQT